MKIRCLWCLMWVAAAPIAAQESDLLGRWEVQVEIYDEGVAMSIVAANHIVDAALIVTFGVETGSIGHRSGKIERFVWKESGPGNLLIWPVVQKGDLAVISGNPLYAQYDLSPDGLLLLVWPSVDWRRSLFLLRRLP